ncbi:YveK family protein [Cytobacillus gottheilii]|uniref:Capsular biosynthesis protein n=1 Tax=Cytobacillus gottheilii TaxID=859144 RepID=A0ABX8FBA7_9BACI|nr:Wzz/FepE/Etk N-terminal domain-containing protein [Cytobacillus gottheilii]QVY61299.1 capsular biosynthesis protein [Cytobacillus gottheilii]
MEETISLKELFQTLKKRMALIIIITLVAVMASGAVSYFVLTPVYQSSTQILVNQTAEEGQYSTNEVQTNLQLINTYNIIIKSPVILEKVIDELNLNMSASQLNAKLTVQNEQNSQVVNLSVQDENAATAAEIANTTAEVFRNEIATIMSIDVNDVTILSPAVVTENQSPIKPQPLLNIAIALVVGAMAGVGLAFLLEYMDNTVKTEQDIEKIAELPVIGVIATIDNTAETASRAERTTRLRGESIGS